MTKREQLYTNLENEWKKYKDWLLCQPPERILDSLWKYVRMTDVLDFLKSRILYDDSPYDDETINTILDNNISLSDICDEMDIIDNLVGGKYEDE